MSVIEEIVAERQWQMAKWGNAHDDEHDTGTIARAGSVYAGVAANQIEDAALGIEGEPLDQMQPPDAWPWEHESFNPQDIRRNLIRAAALIVAEVERLDRRGGP